MQLNARFLKCGKGRLITLKYGDKVLVATKRSGFFIFTQGKFFDFKLKLFLNLLSTLQGERLFTYTKYIRKLIKIIFKRV